MQATMKPIKIKMPRPNPRPDRRIGRMPEEHRQACIDYYVATHTSQDIARMLVDLEWREGCEPPIEDETTP
jgi:hypothetical protein